MIQRKRFVLWIMAFLVPTICSADEIDVAVFNSANQLSPPLDQRSDHRVFRDDFPVVPVQYGRRAGMRTLGEPGWFSVGAPDGFDVSADRTSGRIRLSSRQGVVDIWPIFLPDIRTPAQVAAVLASVSRQLGATPQYGDTTRWGDPRPMNTPGRMSFRQFGRDGPTLRISSATFVQTPNGATGLVTMVSTDEDSFEQNKSVFEEILQSFQPAAGSSTPSNNPPQSSLTFVRWTDPKEQAFSIEVPRGWTVEGGMIRPVFNAATPVVIARSEDMTMLIQVGDARVNHMIQEPMPQAPMAIAGMQRYAPAMEFLQRWIQEGECQNVRFEFVRRRPELEAVAKRAQDAVSGGVMETQAQVAEARFHASFRGHSVIGHFMATTVHLRLPDLPAGTWMVTLGQPAGFIAAEGRESQAAEALGRLQSSFQYNPQWLGQSIAAAGESSRIWHEASEAVNSTIVNGYYDRQRQVDDTLERGSNARRGVSIVVDEQTGQRYQVQSGSNYFWITNGGLIAGTNTPFNPAPLYFREMMELPR